MSHSHTLSGLGRTLQARCSHGWVLLMVIAFMALFAQNSVIAGQRFYAIQVSSCKQQQSAVTEVNRFKKQGYDAFSRQEKIKNQESWYRVYVGKHGNREEALKEAKAMKKQGHISYYSIRAVADLMAGERPRKEPVEKKPGKTPTKSEASALPPEKGGQSKEKAKPGDAPRTAMVKPEAAKSVKESQAPSKKDGPVNNPAQKTPTFAPATGTPGMEGGSRKEAPPGGAFQGAPAKPGAGGAIIKFKVPEKKEVPRETVPAGQDKEDSRGPLRRKAAVVSKDAIREMLITHRFYSTCSNHNFDFCNPEGDFANQFEDNGNGTITDRATHLMWEKGGSEERRTFLDALKYAQELNNKRFGGYSDWRVPTIEELASLLESSWKNEDLFIEPIFNAKQKSCWSTDAMGLERAWKVDFHLGYGADDPMTFLYWVRAVRSVQ
jgi:hypothetical protein